jgi:hypothetical protein
MFGGGGDRRRSISDVPDEPDDHDGARGGQRRRLDRAGDHEWEGDGAREWGWDPRRGMIEVGVGVEEEVQEPKGESDQGGESLNVASTSQLADDGSRTLRGGQLGESGGAPTKPKTTLKAKATRGVAPLNAYTIPGVRHLPPVLLGTSYQ